jgi:hypothetical protein
MFEFLDRYINIALPRVRDFRGLSPTSFDGKGNYAIGNKEHIVFPEIDYDKDRPDRGASTWSSAPRPRPTMKRGRCWRNSTFRSASPPRASGPRKRPDQTKRSQNGEEELDREERSGAADWSKQYRRPAGAAEADVPRTCRCRWKSGSPPSSSWRNCRATPRRRAYPQPVRDHRPAARLLPQAAHVAHCAARACLRRARFPA